MKTRKLGKFEVSAVGMGCMGFSMAYGQTPPKEESIRLMRLAHEMGCTFYDTAEISLAGGEYAALTAKLDKLKVYGVRTDDEIARLGELRKELYGGSGVPFK